MRNHPLFVLFSLALIVVVIGKYVIVAQTGVTGEWTATVSTKEAGKIQLNLERQTARGGHNQHGSSFSLDELQGLSRDQTQNGNVSFRLVREAGTIDFRGAFTNGRGAGTFTFSPNGGFVDAMRSRGFDFDKQSSKGDGSAEDRLFTAAMVNVTTALADDLRSANFGNLGVEDLFKAAIFKVDGKFMAEMKSTGFPNLGMEDLVKARIFKIDADYVRQVRDMGFASEDFEGLVKFRIFKVTPDFLSEIKAEGFGDLSAEDIVKFRIFKLDRDFIREAKAEEPNITVEGLVQRRIGVRRR
jgi:hypothetical protein